MRQSGHAMRRCKLRGYSAPGPGAGGASGRPPPKQTQHHCTHAKRLAPQVWRYAARSGHTAAVGPMRARGANVCRQRAAWGEPSALYWTALHRCWLCKMSARSGGSLWWQTARAAQARAAPHALSQNEFTPVQCRNPSAMYLRRRYIGTHCSPGSLRRQTIQRNPWFSVFSSVTLTPLASKQPAYLRSHHPLSWASIS